ncbi:MAG: hypothetical protein KAH95_03355 [Spirochaetales bacterium]|nr:hypothetical protein [Spirochaetales bacterium]
MNLFNSSNIGTLVVGALFTVVLLAISFVRNLEAKRLRTRLGEGSIILSAYNVHFYGVESVPGIPFNSMGALGLSSEGLYYISRYYKQEVFVSGKQMTSITATDDFKGKNMYGNIVAINFVNEKGEKDRVGLRIPYPEKWSKAINGLFFS